MNNKLLNKYQSKESINQNIPLSVELVKNAKLLPSSEFLSTISAMDVYDNERQNSNKIRLSFTIYPYCTNVLCNNITEIVKDDYSRYLTNTKTSTNSNIIGKQDLFDLHDAVRDTQLSNAKCHWLYFCGTNIFNNHILRNKTFKAVCQPLTNDNNFNTIFDYMREENGSQVNGYTDSADNQSSPQLKLHLYLRDDIDSFQMSIENNLTDKNGWLGFTNKSNIDTFDSNGNSLNINKIINSSKACEFIYMYPTPDLFYFIPIYNQRYKRYEKNWNYCLTYPSTDSRTKKDDSNKFKQFLNQDINSLKLIFFEEKNNQITCYSIAQHGLQVGDVINLYNDNTNELIIENAEVISIGDSNQKEKKFVFTISNNGIFLSNKWKPISEDEYNQGYTNNPTLIISNNKTKAGSYYIINDKVNLDDSAQSFSFKKLINGVAVDYYVRYFSKIPNWKFSDKKISEKNIYEDTDFFKKYQQKEYDFQNINSNMAYAKTIYNDDVGQIVFTDDIDLSFLHDNLGRPLHEVFLTIMKNNRGYKKWYGIGGQMRASDEDIEFSHAFGKVTQAFRFSKYSLANDNIDNVLTLNTIDQRNGYGEINYIDDEITEFIGDICYYSSSSAEEVSIQTISYRFNTAQRELKNEDGAFEVFNNLIYDEIITDDYDSASFKTETESISNVCQRKEGYYYQAHYPIQIHTLSDLQSAYPRTYKILQYKNREIIVDKQFTLQTNDKCYLYNIQNGNLETLQVIENINSKTFKINTTLNITTANISQYRILTLDPNVIPKFAQIINDGTCRFAWRNIIINGYDIYSDIEEYPFTNGAFYINKRINFYLLRQDPHDDIKNYTSSGWSLKSLNFPFDYSGKTIQEDTLNNYYEEENILC